jgi:poly-gamma-glutamate capsule biosynthesis protein CapA/YwtB (metallophosphatase superfamily)
VTPSPDTKCPQQIPKGSLPRRRFLAGTLSTLLGGLSAAAARSSTAEAEGQSRAETGGLKLLLTGDVMTGRGIDQLLPQSVSPEIFESYLTAADQYIEVAEQVSGPIPRPVDYTYVWGDALHVIDAARPALRIVNLETAVTTSDEHWPGKGIHYRMHPANLPVLQAAGIDCCTLANNHVLDWGYDGLEETLRALREGGLASAGAGLDLEQAMAPAVLEIDAHRRVILFSLGHGSSGIGDSWRASPGRPGVWLMDELDPGAVALIARQVAALRQPGDIVIASVHWGGNWGYDVPGSFREFAHDLIDRAGVDLLHGHSSHHPRGIEVYRNKLILYGCGDFINDYEGITSHAEYRGDLRVMYLPELDPHSGELQALSMPVFRSHKLSLRRASEADIQWLAGTLDRASRPLGPARVEPAKHGLRLRRD